MKEIKVKELLELLAPVMINRKKSYFQKKLSDVVSISEQTQWVEQYGNNIKFDYNRYIVSSFPGDVKKIPAHNFLLLYDFPTVDENLVEIEELIYYIEGFNTYQELKARIEDGIFSAGRFFIFIKDYDGYKNVPYYAEFNDDWDNWIEFSIPCLGEIYDVETVYNGDESSKIYQHGEENFIDISPIIYDSLLYVPIRALAETLDWRALWDADTCELTLKSDDGDRIVLVENEFEATVNDETISLINAPIVINGSMMLSELSAITIEAVKARKANINCKGKMRVVILPKDLCKLLLEYAKGQKITSGPVFVTRTGKPLDRSTIWKMMKSLCESAGVDKDKVFPHNLRHLFARTYYSLQKDIVRLADILGHSSVNTTRIYTMETGDVHRRQIQELGLLRL